MQSRRLNPRQVIIRHPRSVGVAPTLAVLALMLQAAPVNDILWVPPTLASSW